MRWMQVPVYCSQKRIGIVCIQAVRHMRASGFSITNDAYR
jgi:hypothetical protein